MVFVSETITSRNNPTVKWAASLGTKKGRDEERHFIAEGEKLTLEALSSGMPVSHIFIEENKYPDFILALKSYSDNELYKSTQVYKLSEGAFSKISTEKSPQGVISAIKYLDFFRDIDIIYKEDFFLANDERAIILCSVRDPGNLGAVIRSSVAFGVDHIILTDDCASPYNPKAVRAAMGSLFRVKLTRVGDIASLIRAARMLGREVYAAELTDNATSLAQIDLSARDLVIIGNEGHGIPSDISALASASVYIPISKKTESLNAAVAAALFMWEQSKK